MKNSPKTNKNIFLKQISGQPLQICAFLNQNMQNFQCLSVNLSMRVDPGIIQSEIDVTTFLHWIKNRKIKKIQCENRRRKNRSKQYVCSNFCSFSSYGPRVGKVFKRMALMFANKPEVCFYKKNRIEVYLTILYFLYIWKFLLLVHKIKDLLIFSQRNSI
jgi:hypothetical protein